MKKAFLLFIISITFGIISCVFTTDGYDIILKNEIQLESFDINDPHMILSVDNKLSIIYLDDNLFTAEIYNIESGDSLGVYEIDIAETYIYDCDLSSNYLVFLGKNQTDMIMQLIVYDLDTGEKTISAISDNPTLVPYDNAVEIEGSSIIVNLCSINVGDAYTFYTDATNLGVVNLIYEYVKTRVVMDGSIEEIYGGRNTIQNGRIIMSSIDFIDEFNYVSIYSVEDQFIEFTTQGFFQENDQCNVQSAYINEAYVTLKTSCESGNKFYMFDSLDTSRVYVVDFPNPLDDYKVLAVNEYYIIFGNGNMTRSNAKLFFYDINDYTLNEIESNENNVSFFGNEIYLYDTRLCIINSNSDKYFTMYDLESKEYLYTASEYQLIRAHGIVGPYLLFTISQYESEGLVGYNLLTNEVDVVLESIEREYEVYTFESQIVVIYENNKLKIFNLHRFDG